MESELRIAPNLQARPAASQRSAERLGDRDLVHRPGGVPGTAGRGNRPGGVPGTCATSTKREKINRSSSDCMLCQRGRSRRTSSGPPAPRRSSSTSVPPSPRRSSSTPVPPSPRRSSSSTPGPPSPAGRAPPNDVTSPDTRLDAKPNSACPKLQGEPRHPRTWPSHATCCAPGGFHTAIQHWSPWLAHRKQHLNERVMKMSMQSMCHVA